MSHFLNDGRNIPAGNIPKPLVQTVAPYDIGLTEEQQATVRQATVCEANAYRDEYGRYWLPQILADGQSVALTGEYNDWFAAQAAAQAEIDKVRGRTS